MGLFEDYNESFEEAAELLHTLIQITANAVDPKDFGAIRQRARDWLNTHTGANLLNDRDSLKAMKKIQGVE